MARIRYRRTSPYGITGQTSWYLDLYEHRPIPPDSTDIAYRVSTRFENRPDLLSYEEYGTPDYWWIFSVRNPDQIKDPIYDFVDGLEIYIPTRQRLESLIR